jgi:hypothetical protein
MLFSSAIKFCHQFSSQILAVTSTYKGVMDGQSRVVVKPGTDETNLVGLDSTK